MKKSGQESIPLAGPKDGADRVDDIRLSNFENSPLNADKHIEFKDAEAADSDGGEGYAPRYERGPKASVRRSQKMSNLRKFSQRSSVVSSQVSDKMRKISTEQFSNVSPTDENQDRGNWDNPIEFFLSCLGYAVGLGNIWRFPYLCFKNGGGAFLIPYLLMLFLAGLPLLFMELSMGQYSSSGPITVWKMAPIFQGLGIGMVLCSITMSIYYNMVTGWALYYLYLSVRLILPWACCDGEWSSNNCVTFSSADTCPAGDANTTMANATVGNVSFVASDFFHNYVLSMSSGIEDVGSMQLDLVLVLLIAWIIVFLVLAKGIKTFGKVVYFSSTFPYLILIILFIRAVMEPGAGTGILYFLTPDWPRLLELGVWSDAAAQIFYSTGVCIGGAITLSSYNQFKNNLYRDAIFVAIGNSCTSIFSGFVVFSILGFMAHSQNTTIDKVVAEGPGLTFIAYPQAVTLLPGSPIWSTLFFLMLSTLALSSMFPTVENIVSSIVDGFERLRPFKFWVLIACCTVMFLLGLPLTTNGGMYILQLMDGYGVGYALLILGICEILVVGWRYGADRLLNNISRMIDRRPCFLWRYLWQFVTPALLIFAIVSVLIQLKPLKYGTYVFPAWSAGVGWCLAAVPLIPIPAFAVGKLISHMRATGKSLGASLNELTLPTDDWGPALDKYRRE